MVPRAQVRILLDEELGHPQVNMINMGKSPTQNHPLSKNIMLATLTPPIREVAPLSRFRAINNDLEIRTN